MVDSPKAQDQEAQLKQAEEAVRAGGVVIVPTETLYALAADSRKEGALLRIFEIKKRDPRNPLPLIASERAVVDRITVRPDGRTNELMDRFWPGSLTILLRPSQEFSKLLLGPSGCIAVRLPPPCPARTLAGRCGGLITATSANLSGAPNPTQVSRISKTVLEAVDAVVDLGPAPGNRPSTIVEPLGDCLEILREGTIPGEVLSAFYKRCLKRLDKDV